MNNIKYIFVIYLFVSLCEVFASPRLRSISKESLDSVNAELNRSGNWRAIGYLQYQNSSTFLHQTGFFVAPNVFMTALSPVSAGIDCASTKIIPAVEFLDAASGQSTKFRMQCKKVLYSNKEEGILVFRTDEKSDYHIDLQESERLFRKQVEVSAFGFSEEAVLMVANSCVVEGSKCNICGSAKLDAESWLEAKCLVRSGMAGSPVVRWEDGRWVAVGMLGTIVAKIGQEKNSETTSFVRFKDIEVLNKVIN